MLLMCKWHRPTRPVHAGRVACHLDLDVGPAGPGPHTHCMLAYLPSGQGNRTMGLFSFGKKATVGPCTPTAPFPVPTAAAVTGLPNDDALNAMLRLLIAADCFPRGGVGVQER
jgi:hypothetical protein